jgi:membrane protease YdiL (CAAX protease family)
MGLLHSKSPWRAPTFMATPEAQSNLAEHHERTLVAPRWHTVILVVVVVGISLTQALQQRNLGALELKSRLPLYFTQIAFELLLFCYVWLLGLKLTHTPVRELIGGRWASAADFLRDLGVALAFWLVVAGVLLIMNRILGQNTAIRTLEPLLPQGLAEMSVWVALCVTAGFCEEFIFRGYLQRQFFALTGRQGWAIALQAVIFGAGHGYQGWKGMITIVVYGAMFGILAIRRKSLRPGMIQHAGQDIFSGIVGSILARRHYI